MVLDSSVMNVSISQIVADLNTTVTGVQSAITMYTLVMAALMLVGAKLGGAAGAAIAAGPLIGGYVTTTWSWRWVFVGEVLVVIVVLAVHRRMKRAPKPEQVPKLDYGGAALSAVALGLIVFGILKSSTWGWIRPIAAPTIGGHAITPFGFSLVPFLIVAGFVVLGFFLAWEERRERLVRSALLNRALLKIETLRG